MELKKFKCVRCGNSLKEIIILSNKHIWYKCHICGTEASQFSPKYWERFDLSEITIKKEV